MIRKVDAIQIHVPDWEAGLRLYREQLGHEIIWRTSRAIGQRLPESDAELVIQTEGEGVEPNLLVGSVDEAVERIVVAGGSVLVAPFEIQIGRCAVVRDPGVHRWCCSMQAKGC